MSEQGEQAMGAQDEAECQDEQAGTMAAAAALESVPADALAEDALEADEAVGDEADADRRGPVAVEALPRIVEALLLSSDKALNVDQLLLALGERSGVDRDMLREALARLAEDCAERSFFLKETASGFRLQLHQDYAPWILGMREEKPPRFSRAALETLALIAYRQPVTRGDIENVRGVAVSSNIIRMLEEREWVRVVGHKDVPGRPALYATTRQFLDYFNLKSLAELPTLAEVRDLDTIAAEIDDEGPDVADQGRLSAVMDLDALAGAEPAVDDDADAAFGDEPAQAVASVVADASGSVSQAEDQGGVDACEAAGPEAAADPSRYDDEADDGAAAQPDEASVVMHWAEAVAPTGAECGPQAAGEASDGEDEELATSDSETAGRASH